ncbi:MAG: hypothetical protein AMXMBFR33_01480 [Candidatus Xenobia bacterium]
MSVSCAALDQRVSEYALTSVRVATGEEEHWDLVGTWWASVLEVDVSARAAYGKQDAEPTHTLRFRGRREFRYDRTLFAWGERILRPTTATYSPKGARAAWTIIQTRDITDDGIPIPELGGGSGS